MYLKGIFSKCHNKTDAWLENLPVTKYLLRLDCSCGFLFFYFLNPLVLYLSKSNIKFHQIAVIAKIKHSRGADFSDAGVHWVSSELTCLRAPSLFPTKAHTVLLNSHCGQPQPWQTTGLQKNSAVLVLFFSSFLSLPPSCKAVLTI